MERREDRRIPQINSEPVGFLFNDVERSQGAEFERGKKEGRSGLVK